MGPIKAGLSRLTTLASIGSFILTVVNSIRIRGIYPTLLFVALGVGLPIAGEYYAINTRRVIRHHLQPQLKGVPLAIGLGWYITVYNTFTILESLAVQYCLSKHRSQTLLPLATALTATSMDLVTDVALLDQDFWEWNINGPYASEVAGPNGKRGIPLANYAAWLGLTTLVTGIYQLVRRRQPASHSQLNKVGQVWTAQQAALMLLPVYLVSVGWELRQRRWRYILYSALFPLVLVKALLGR